MTFSKKICSSCGKSYENELDFLKNTARWRVCSKRNLWFNCRCGSTLMLKKDHFDWYRREQVKSSRASSVFLLLNGNGELSYMKSSVIEIQNVLADQGSDSTQISLALKKDQILINEVLNTAKRLTIAYDDLIKIDNIQHAVSYLGKRRVSDITLAVSLKNLEIETRVFNKDEFWDRSLTQAIVAEFLAKKYAPYLNSDEMYLIGYLFNLGKIVSAYYFPSKVDKIYRTLQSQKNSYTWLSIEKLLDIDSHLILGEIACVLWGLPDYVLEVISSHSELSRSRQKLFSKSDFAIFASIMTSWVLYDLKEVNYAHLELICSRLGIKKTEVEDLARILGDLIKRTKAKG